MRALTLLMCVTLGLAGCSKDKKSSKSDLPESDAQHLMRVSMALRGVRPSIEDIETIEKDPTAIAALIDGYLESAEFGETVMDLHNEAWLLRDETTLFPAVDDLAGRPVAEVNRSVTDAPLELIRHIVQSDRPYTDIVTTSDVRADADVARLWGVPYSGSGDWETTQWTDGRPAAGILSSSWVFYRHISVGLNYNRGRANRVSTALLCYNFLNTDVSIDSPIDLSDPDAVAQAVTTQPECVSCHQTLDPLASFFWGHVGAVNTGAITDYPVPYYNPSFEVAWQFLGTPAPGFFGSPGTDLEDLGAMIAADPGFANCAARRFSGYLTQRDPDNVPLLEVDELANRFSEGGFHAKELAKEVVLSEAFRGAETPEYLIVRPAQWARMIEDLTGYNMDFDFPFDIGGAPFGTVNLADSDLLGFRTLGGGIDARFVTTPSHSMNPTASLFMRTFAADAAGTVVDEDFAQPASERRLLTLVSTLR